MSEGRWEFYIQIAEACDTMRRHSGDFVKLHFESTDGRAATASMMAYHLRQAENLARTLAGARPEKQGGG